MTAYRSKGFTLVELAIVLAIIGIILSLGVSTLRSVANNVNYSSTVDRMDGVAKALGLYAQNHYYLPCPAPLPVNGISTGIAATTCPAGAAALNQGVLPFVTLGLREEQARDVYSNYYTYIVNPALATYTTVQNDPVTRTLATSACRTPYVWISMGLVPANKNPIKARFCCPAGGTVATTDLEVRSNTTAWLTVSPVRADPSDAINGPLGLPVDVNSGNIDTPIATTTFPASAQTAAFVLISHGKNMNGAYRKNGGGRIGTLATMTAQERGNADNDNILVSAPRSGNQANYFDDIVTWRNQDQLLSALGQDSCTRP